IALAAYFDLGLLGIISAGVIGSIFNFSYLFYSTRKIIKIHWAFDFDIWKETLQKSWPIAVSIAFNLVYLKTDTIIMSLYHSPSDVGLYGASFRFLEILIMIPTMFMGLILPLLSNYWSSKNFIEFKKIFESAFDVIIIIAIPLAIGTLFLAKPIIILVAGKEFAPATPILKIIIFATAIVFVGIFYGHTIVAIEKQKKMIWAYATTAILSLTAYLIFIPKYSYYGAAWATVFAESLIAIICAWMVIKTTKIFPDFLIILKVFLASGIMAIILYFIKKQSLFISLPSSIAVYFFALYILKGIPKNLLKEIIKIK
ncbi:MAG: oligosaccharide flippase family protein, partial [Xanthomonadaceae bacterium]|nr:oligosaccharide flippase family protein [Rhodospirillaceae bacterium]NIA17915.1 oligosaccharide flippase family protein [Xanthomonadaceae bacterium]